MRFYGRRRSVVMVALLHSVIWCVVLLYALWTLPIGAQELRISHQFHAESDTRGRATQLFAAEVTRQSADLKFKIYPQLSMGLTRDEQLEALQSGKLDFAVLPFIVPAKKVPELSLALLPGLVPNFATARALKGSEVHTKLQEAAAANGLRIVTWWWMRGGFATTGKDALAPTSTAGLKLQSCGLTQKLLADAGAEMGDEPLREIPMLLDMGALDGVAMPYEEFVALSLHEHAKFATFGGPSLVTCFSPMLMSKKTWNRLTPRQQQSIDEAAAASDAYFERGQLEMEEHAHVSFRKAGASVRSLTRQEYVSWLQLARDTAWARYANASATSRDLIDKALSVILATHAMQDNTLALTSP